ncbi:UNVERIFIED_CONTAM: hypothetical protein IGO34_28200, partial [Salmonella enterica subsp. enterica serovar Weltevreden]
MALASLAGGLVLPVFAQTTPDPETMRRTQEERDRRAQSLRQIEEALAASASSRTALEAEVAAIGSDRTKLSAALL